MDAVNSSEIVSDANEIDPIRMQCTAGKKYSETAQSVASNGTEECKKQRHWSELPSLPLERIYSFLRREDQFNMSLVCSKWSEGYGLPSVWKTFIFHLTKSQLSMDTCPVMKFVQRYSRMFRHVEVYHEFSRKKRFINTWCRHFIVFLQFLTSNSQLISVRFVGLSRLLRHIDNTTYDDIYRAIKNFLRSQNHLQRAEFYGYSFRIQEGVELLRILIQNNRKSLTHLVLKGFVLYDPMGQEQNSNFAQNLPILADLPSLTTFEIDYTLIFENMVARQCTALQTIKSCQTLVLSKIILEYENTMINIEDFRGLTSTDWQFLKMLSPNLQVELIIYTDALLRREVEFLIVPNMPITLLKYNLHRHEAFERRMITDELFRHLLACKTNDHLVSLNLWLWCPVQDLVSPFIPFLPACKKLKYLVINIHYPTNGLDLMEYWLNNRPEYLEKVNIYIWDIEDDEDYTTLKNLTSQYVSRLKLIGMNVEVEINY
ncbi:hypothetical protein AVEN_18388-1 [Araneus ventricosus]|uniref:F-box domain-containing protein n=1 Tax=Araneus ventricosus TaxID=182803 RepID=A0A4Y2P6Q7_ARAVE|nr:hypothetical protein AVEN_18388-1 [Araneus ventricosus]